MAIRTTDHKTTKVSRVLLADHIKNLIAKAGMTDSEFLKKCERVKVSRSCAENIISGTSNPWLSTIELICHVLRIEPAELIFPVTYVNAPDDEPLTKRDMKLLGKLVRVVKAWEAQNNQPMPIRNFDLDYTYNVIRRFEGLDINSSTGEPKEVSRKQYRELFWGVENLATKLEAKKLFTIKLRSRN